MPVLLARHYPRAQAASPKSPLSSSVAYQLQQRTFTSGAPQPFIMSGKTSVSLDTADEPRLNKRRSLERQQSLIIKEDLAEIDDSAVTEVTSSEEKALVRYRDQGDETMHTLENVQARYDNRFKSELLDVIALWWICALKSMPPMLWDGNARRTWTLPERNYKLMMMKLAKTLLEPDEEWDEDEAARLAHESWEADCKGSREFTRTHFYDSIFELADVWTLGVDVEEYVDFLKIALGHTSDGAVWKDDSDIYCICGSRPSSTNRVRRKEGHQKRHAAVKIQSMSRRKRGQQQHKAQRQGAIKIQSHARRRHDQRQHQSKRRGAIRIQSHARRRQCQMGACHVESPRPTHAYGGSDTHGPPCAVRRLQSQATHGHRDPGPYAQEVMPNGIPSSEGPSGAARETELCDARHPPAFALLAPEGKATLTVVGTTPGCENADAIPI